MKSQVFCVFGLLLAACASPLGAQGGGNDGISTTEQTTSPFIKRKDICVATEQQYETPAVMLVGTEDKLLRCVYGDPETCETFYTTGSTVYSLLVVGEYIYVGLYKELLKCDINQVGSCQIYHTFDTHVHSLAAAGGYLYAGLERGSIFRCQLNKPNSCQLHVIFGENSVYALIHVDEYLYAGFGVWNGEVMRCSLVTKNNCTLMYTMTEGVTGLSNVGNSIFAITYGDHHIWNCSRKADGANNSCVTLPLDHDRPIDMASFLGVWYTVQNEQRIHTCEWANNSVVCTRYGTIDKVSSIAFAYATVHMRGRYTNENISCVWQRGPNCPPLVSYYDAVQRTQFEIHVKDGILYNGMGTLVDTTDADDGRAIFAMGRDGRILLSNLHSTGLLHTSSFFAGGPVAGAGELVVKGGVIVRMTTCSDHYRPSLELNRQVVESLRAQGYTHPVHVQACAGGERGQSDGDIN